MLPFLGLETEERHLLDGSLTGFNNQQCFEVGLWILLDGSMVVDGLLNWNTLFSQVN
jgi:hypothetical protein